MDLNEDFFVSFLYRAKRNQVKMLMKRGYRDAKKEFSGFLGEEPSEEMKNKIIDGINSLDISFFDNFYDNELQVFYIISKKALNTKFLLKKIFPVQRGKRVRRKDQLFSNDLEQQEFEEELEEQEEALENQKRKRRQGRKTIQKQPEEEEYQKKLTIKDFYLLNHIMLITNTSLTKDAYSELKGIFENIEFFLLEELTYDPTEHFLCPEFILLKDEEAKAFLEKNNLTYEDLPIISRYDPISRYYGAKTGDIFKIKRTNMLLETFSEGNVTFRVVRDVAL